MELTSRATASQLGCDRREVAGAENASVGGGDVGFVTHGLAWRLDLQILVRLPTRPVAKSGTDERLSRDEKEIRMPHDDVLQVLNDPLAQELLRSNIPA